MQYPLKKTFTLYLTLKIFWRVKTVRLEIPQATIQDIAEFSQLTPERKTQWLILKLREWGAGGYAGQLIGYLGENIETILADTFFCKREFDKLPYSILTLATKEGIYNYDSPDSVLFATIATEYGITPHDLLGYTMDELQYLLVALQYKYLNEDQKRELQRLARVKEFQDNKETIDADVELLDNYFNNLMK